ncbi:MAG: AAA family ATPase, partial [Candidatus Hodarchaeota archaeon]
MNIADLADLNPWWTDPSEIKNIKEIRSWKETKSKIEYIPRVIHRFKLDEDMIYTLRGPRQVGKTTLLFILIYRLLERGIEPRRIFYWTMDLVKDRTELQKILMTYISWLRNQTERRAYIFLDEITSVSKWQNTIKFLVDTNKLRDFFVLVTASHTMDIARGAERLPGRQGTADPLPNKVLLPMKFIEHIELRNDKIKSWILDTNFKALETRKEIFNDLIKGKPNKTLEELQLYGKKIDDLFIDYTITGGVIKAIDTYLGEGIIPITVFNDYKEFILGDFLKAGMNEDYLIQILTQLLETHTTPIGWETLKKQTTIGSRDTVSKYVNHLQYSYIVSIIKSLKHEKNTPDYQKNKKVYFSDPFIFH